MHNIFNSRPLDTCYLFDTNVNLSVCRKIFRHYSTKLIGFTSCNFLNICIFDIRLQNYFIRHHRRFGSVFYSVRFSFRHKLNMLCIVCRKFFRHYSTKLIGFTSCNFLNISIFDIRLQNYFIRHHRRFGLFFYSVRFSFRHKLNMLCTM